MTFNTDRLSTALAGRYRIERHLGEGGMATVYLAQDLKHDRRVAVKVLKPELAAVLGAERFVQEIKTTAALQHPHILPLFDSGTADGFLFYVMPFIDGETLRSKLDRETQLGVADAVRIAREVADALDYAHRHGVIHRDIKPENILLHDGRPIVADFGIALAVSAAAGGRMTETGLSLGTPHYMSPEQATAEKEITARSDIYSIGSVLYEMLTGNPPHTGASAQQIIMKIITEPAAPVTQLRKSVPPHVAAAIAKSLEKLPADRFASAREFADALGNAAYTNAQFTGSAVQGQVHRESRRTYKYPFIAVSVISAALLVVAMWALSRSEPSRDVSRFSVLLSGDTRNLVGSSVALSPDGRTMVYVAAGERGGTRLLARSFDQLAAIPIANTEGAITPAFSPDGKQIAFVTTSPRALRTIALAGGPAVTRADSLVDNGGIAWGSDDFIYFDSKFAGDVIARVRADGGTPEATTVMDSLGGETYHFRPSSLPRGRGFLFVIAYGATGGFKVGVFDARTRKHKALVTGGIALYAQSGHLVYVASGTMMAVPFDLESLEMRGEPQPLFTGVTPFDLALSESGILTYRTAVNATVRELEWIGRDGSASRIDSQFTGAIAQAWVSPDGKSSLVNINTGQSEGVTTFAAAGELWIKQLEGESKTQLAARVRSAAWSPNGKQVAYSDTSGISIVPADGSALAKRVLTARRTVPFVTQWSHDGKWLLFVTANDIYAVGADGDTVPRPLITGPATQTNARLSPDGRWLAYVSDESGRFELYVVPFPDTRQARPQRVSENGAVPGAGGTRWSADGRELFYVDEQRRLIAVPILPGPAFAIGKPQGLFSMNPASGNISYDVAPDRKRFLVVRAVSALSQPPELILVQNFHEELKARVPR